MTNKVGFTDAQQTDLKNLIVFGQMGAAIVTLCLAKSISQTEMFRVLIELTDFARQTYPGGPREVAAKLNGIAQFCDLSIVTTPRDMVTDKPL